MSLEKKQSGFVALITAIILSLILIIITTTFNQTNFFTRGMLLDSEYKERSAALAEACVDVARLKLANDPAYTVSDLEVPIGGDKCFIKSVSPSGLTKTIKTEAVFKGANTKLLVTVIVSPTNVSIDTWTEVLAF